MQQQIVGAVQARIGFSCWILNNRQWLFMFMFQFTVTKWR